MLCLSVSKSFKAQTSKSKNLQYRIGFCGKLGFVMLDVGQKFTQPVPQPERVTIQNRGGSELSGLIDKIGSIADSPDTTDEERLQHRFLSATGLVMSAGGLLWGVVALTLGFGLQSLVPFGYVVITAFNILGLSNSKNFPLA